MVNASLRFLFLILLSVTLIWASDLDYSLNSLNDNGILFYSGSFDPATKVHVEIIKKALQKFEGLKKLYVLVNVDGEKTYKASVGERIKMLSLALNHLQDRVEIIPIRQSEKDSLKNKLVDASNVSVQFNIIGQDSYEKLPAEAMHDKRKYWIILPRGQGPPVVPRDSNAEVLEIDIGESSSTLVRSRLMANEPIDSLVEPEVAKYINNNSLYKPPKSEFLELQERIFMNGFMQFKKDLKSRFPERDFSKLIIPKFHSQMSRNAIADAFLRAAIESQELSESELKIFHLEVRKLLFYNYNGEFYAKLSLLGPVREIPKNLQFAIKKEELLPSRRALNFIEFNMDLKEYSLERISNELIELIKKGDAKPYFHIGSMEEAIGYHSHQGFDLMFNFYQRKGMHTRPLLVLINSKTNEKRIVFSGITCDDRLHQIDGQILAAGYLGERKIIRHIENPLRKQLDSIKYVIDGGSNDMVIIGSKNRIWNQIKKSDEWDKYPILTSDPEIDLYVNRKTEQKVYNVKNVYGEEATEVLEMFYSRGLRGCLKNSLSVTVTVPVTVTD